MAATREDISEWFDRALNNKDAFMIVVCDSYDYGDYPVFVDKEENFEAKYREMQNAAMQQIMEVYDISKPKEEQLSLTRCWNFPEGFKK